MIMGFIFSLPYFQPALLKFFFLLSVRLLWLSKWLTLFLLSVSLGPQKQLT